MPLEIVKMHFDCALVVAPCAFWHMVVTFVAGARETSVLLRNVGFLAGAALWTWW